MVLKIKPIPTTVLLTVVVGSLLYSFSWAGNDNAGKQSGENHFDKVIAPILARHCLECHGSSQGDGGLDLSQEKSALAGGDGGKVIVPGQPDKSSLWKLVHSGKMPRKRPPLSAREKLNLKKWIEEGAVWGSKTIDPFAYSTGKRGGYDWWALQPIGKITPPQVKNEQWVHNDIDRFILARLEGKNLQPAKQSDRRTLIRRLYFDLIGLPPEPEAVERFVRDPSPKAYEELVDELLDSPHYGERWGRHWLDVVRYGESQGYERNRIRENMWKYRDWVIRAFNEDMPYDEFIRKQLAGDVLYPDDVSSIIATGYHVCGTWDQVAHLEGSGEMRKAARQDELEDLVATMGQAFLGLTINCARCHDHKFDPITQKEYYQVASLLSGVNQEERERATISTPAIEKHNRQLSDKVQTKRDKLIALEDSMRKRLEPKKAPRQKLPEGLLVYYPFLEGTGNVIQDQSSARPAIHLQVASPKAVRWKKGSLEVLRETRLIAQPEKELARSIKKSGQFSFEVWITPAKEQQSGPARIVSYSRDGNARNFTLGQDNDRYEVRFRTDRTSPNGLPGVTSPAGSAKKKLTYLAYTFSRDGIGKLFLDGKEVGSRKIGGTLNNWDENFQLVLANEARDTRAWLGTYHLVAIYDRKLSSNDIARHFRQGPGANGHSTPIAEILAKATTEEKVQYEKLSREVEIAEREYQAKAVRGPAHVIIPRQPTVTRLLSRGDYRKPKEIVSPAGSKALQGISWDFGLAPDAPEAQRRVKLAEWIANPKNPLTARVLVNRLWHYHFGRGIVSTPSDFGFNGGLPSHPELLDWLALQFMQKGWKIKDMHRLIILSATYRQSSKAKTPEAEKIDKDNHLLWRFNLHRLEGEITRDALLAISGTLNRHIGGPSYRDVKVDLGNNHTFTTPLKDFNDTVNRRTIYRLWARSGNNPMLESLDCPDPTVMSPRRVVTITPLQALSLLNSEFVEHCAEAFAKRLEREAGANPHKQIQHAFEVAFGRPADLQEIEAAEEFVRFHGLKQFCIVLFNTNEFVHIN